MRIHLDTNLLIQTPQWELLPPGEHEFLVSAIAFAEFSEGAAHPDPAIAADAAIELIRYRAALATRNTTDFAGLERLLTVITL